ncbi:phage antirepressor KilAC domain-containing protein [Mitsuokella sp.]
MTDLVRIDNKQVVTDSRNVAEHFEKQHKHVLETIDNLVAQNSATKNMFLEQTREYRGRDFRFYLMNRDGFSLLVMGFTGKAALEWKLKYIEAFNAMEKAIQTPQLTPAEQMAQGLLAAQKLLAEKDKRIEEMRPKEIFADSVSASDTAILIGELAKIIKQNGTDIGQNRLFQWMRDQKYLIGRKGTDYNMPTQKSMKLGLFTIKETTINHSDGHVSISKTPKVTGKGQVYFVNKFLRKALN